MQFKFYFYKKLINLNTLTYDRVFQPTSKRMGFYMSKRVETAVKEFDCPGCKEKLSLETKKCKWCGTYITHIPESVQEENSKKQSFFRRILKKS